MSRPLKIFVVDDDRDAAEGLGEVLEMFGHQVTLAFDGESAVQIFKEQDFDVSLMDVMMPGMNGVESFLEIRKIKPDAKVFMMTGFSVQQLLTQAIENGALGVFDKPVNMEKLMASLEDIKPEGLVLLADDDPNFRATMEDLLRQNGYNVCVAQTGEEAIQKGLDEDVDIMVLDLQMPVLNGLEAYLDLKKRGRAKPTIVVTGHADEETEAIDTLRDMTSTGVLVKPFDPTQLLKALETISQRGGAPANGGAPAKSAAPPSPPEATAAASAAKRNVTRHAFPTAN